LKVVSYKELYGWTMDEIVREIGTKSNCTFCGVFRRQALDRGAVLMRADKIATGHNADDVAETVLLNIVRGDLPRWPLHFCSQSWLVRLMKVGVGIPVPSQAVGMPFPFGCRLGRCAAIVTGEDSSLPRCKPFKYMYEKEIVMYAYYKKLDYFSTECIYAPFAARGAARDFVKELEVRCSRAQTSPPIARHACYSHARKGSLVPEPWLWTVA
jgi:cytoplasmic tRNA 2-thiolation protein 1